MLKRIIQIILGLIICYQAYRIYLMDEKIKKYEKINTDFCKKP